MPQTTTDKLLDGGITIMQPEEGPRCAVDAFLLAAAIPANGADRVLDLGSGVGAVSLALAYREPGIRVAGLEIQPELTHLANENAVRNGFADRVGFHTADLLEEGLARGALDASPEAFDHVAANPPFHEVGSGRPAKRPGVLQAHHMKRGELELWIKFMARMTRRGGSLTLIHLPKRLDGLISCLQENRIGGLKLLPIYPAQGQNASRMIISGVKESKAPSRICPALVLHKNNRGYTKEADQVLRHGKPLIL